VDVTHADTDADANADDDHDSDNDDQHDNDDQLDANSDRLLPDDQLGQLLRAGRILPKHRSRDERGGG
jgi:hypothetical protein